MTKTRIGTATVTDGSGSTHYTIPSDANIGENTLYSVFQENTSYETSTDTSTMHIRVPVTVVASDVLASKGEEATFTATVKHHTSQNVNEGTVQFLLGNNNIGSPVNVVNGVATLLYEIPSNATSGSKIKAKFIQTDTYAASTSAEATLTLRKDPTVTVNDLSANRNTTATITAQITNSNAENINTGQCKLYIDNTQVGNAVNVSEGTVTFSYNVATNAVLGSHTIRVEYQKNEEYNSASGTGTLIVRTPTTLTPVAVSGNKGGTVSVTIQVKDNNNSAVTSGTVNITVGNASPVSATVNNSGEATISYQIPANATGTIQFNGSYIENTNYQGSTTSTAGVITVRKGTVVTVADINCVLGEQVALSATIVDENGDPVTSGTVTFDIEPVTN